MKEDPWRETKRAKSVLNVRAGFEIWTLNGRLKEKKSKPLSRSAKSNLDMSMGISMDLKNIGLSQNKARKSMAVWYSVMHKSDTTYL